LTATILLFFNYKLGTMPAVLSKPQFFASCHYGICDKINQLKGMAGNYHFWVEKNGIVYDPTEEMPHPKSKIKVYIPLDQTDQDKTRTRLTNKWQWDNGWDEDEMIEYLRYMYQEKDYHQFGQCFRNAYSLHIHMNGSKLVCGAFGHKLKNGIVDLDYGY
jgi:hypothetical protein